MRRLACWVLIVLLALPTFAQEPKLTIAFVGDSMADGLWGAMFRRLGKDKCLAQRVSLIRKARNGTGLTRQDQFDWIAEIAKIVDDSHPDLFIGSFGINDRQSIVEKDKHVIPYPSAEFDQRYTALVIDMLNTATAQGAAMNLVGLPVMMEAEANADAGAKNKIFQEAVRQVGSERVTYVSPWTSGSDSYKTYLPLSHTGMVLVRATDGIHFTRIGYDMVMDSLYPSVLTSLKARGFNPEVDCRQTSVR